MLGAICEFAQFINCAAHFVNSENAQQFINCAGVALPYGKARCDTYSLLYRLPTLSFQVLDHEISSWQCMRGVDFTMSL